MEIVESYLKEILGSEARIWPIAQTEQAALPLVIRGIYDVKKAKIFDQEIILLEEKIEDNLTIDQFRKHSEIVEKAFNRPVAFVFPNLEAYKRKRLIQKHVAFITPGKHLFIPQLLIELRNFRQPQQKYREKLLPAAQCVLLFHLLKGDIEAANLKDIAVRLGYTQMTITRVAKDLAEKNLAQIEGLRAKHLVFDLEKKELWQQAQPFLQNPIKKLYYLETVPNFDFIYKAGFAALARYTPISSDGKTYLAVSNESFAATKKRQTLLFIDSFEGPVQLEVWKYNPGVLTDTDVVDPLSLFLSLRDDKDERVQKELDQLLERVW